MLAQDPPISLAALKELRTAVSGRSRPQFFASSSFFAQGTHILTADGEVQIEKLQVGQHIETLDFRPQPVRGVVKYSLPDPVIEKPVRFHEGAIGNRRDLVVSPRHRILISDGIADVYFAYREVLVPAACLTEISGVDETDSAPKFFYQILFDRHQIVFAEGCAVESFRPDNRMAPPLVSLVDIWTDGPLQSHTISAGAGEAKDARPSLLDFEAYLLIREVRKTRVESGRPLALLFDDVPPGAVRCFDRYQREEWNKAQTAKTGETAGGADQARQSGPNDGKAEPARADGPLLLPVSNTQRRPEPDAPD